MRLRFKTLAILAATLVITICFIYLAAQAILLQSYTDLEAQSMKADVGSALREIEYDLSMVDAIAVDYAYWDDTCQYIADHNEAYIESNFVDATLLNQRLNVAIIADANDSVIYAKSVNLTNRTGAPLPAGILENLGPGSPLLRSSKDDSKHGILMVPDGPMLISAYPVKNSDGTGPSQGTLIMGRFLDDNEIGMLKNITGIAMSLQALGEADTPDLTGIASTSGDNGIIVRPIDHDTVSGYALLPDLYRNPAIALRVDMPRTIYGQWQTSMLYIVLLLVFAGILFCIIGVLLMDRFVMRRMALLSSRVSQIGADNDFSGRLPVHGNDELSTFAGKINEALDALDQSQQRLHVSEEKFRSLVENINDVAWEADSDLKLTYVSPQVRNVMGYAPEEILGRSPFDLVEPGEREPIRAIIHDMIVRKGSFALVQFTITRPDGGRAEIEVGGNPIRSPAGEIAGYRGVARDIGERKRAEEALREAYDELELRVQQRTTELKEANDSLESKVQQRTTELAGAVTALQAEVAERKRVEQQIQGSLQEKEVLLKEIHHRVKNNLQIISSLLSLQSEQISTENPAKTFRESQDRIRSMALIHEKLYQSKDISRIDFAEYVRSLTAYLSRSYLTRGGIRVVIDIRGISLDVDKAIPCGLIINELVSNSLKYAFPDDRGGKILIGLVQGDGAYTLTMSDDGVGLPPGMDFQNSPSLGLQLVNTLVNQLEGTIELAGGPGTTFVIAFRE